MEALTTEPGQERGAAKHRGAAAPVLVRAGVGSTAPAAVPGLRGPVARESLTVIEIPAEPPAPPSAAPLPPASQAPAPLPPASPAPVPLPPTPLPPATTGRPEAPVPPRPTTPPQAAAPAPAAPVPAPAVPVPAPAVPLPAPPVPLPAPAVPVPARAGRTAARPPIEPLITRAPSLNWAGPDDHWSRAWGARGPGELPALPAPRSSAVPARTPESLATEAPTAADLELVRASLVTLEPVAERATAHFYALLFLNHPELRSLFPAAMDVQRDRLFRALLTAARRADDPDALARQLQPLGRSHRRFGVTAEHYGPFGECLLAALARYCGNRWDAAAETAWRRTYGLVARLMSEAAENAGTTPSWWQAEIVSHEQRTREIAVLTVRPDQPYPYRAGQYAPLETPWWPRVWRNYSIACAPRPDGLLAFHVKAVPAGWVSNALVHRARRGDLLRLGPPDGGMVVDHEGGGSLLCLGGGTGIAPIRALVEEVADHGPGGRQVQVFYGARRNEELYDLQSLLRLSQRHPWLSVQPVVSDQRTLGLTGTLPEVVEGHGPWEEYDAYVSGPAAMVRRGVDALLRCGVAGERIRHDLGGLAGG